MMVALLKKNPIPPLPITEWNPSWLHRDFNLPRPCGDMLAVYSQRNLRWLEVYGLAPKVGGRAFIVNTYPHRRGESWVYFPADGDIFVSANRWTGEMRVLEVQA